MTKLDAALAAKPTIRLSYKSVDLTGQRFGRLVAIRPVGHKSRSIVWECRCDCGTIKDIRSHNLRTEHAKSCGCLLHEDTTPRKHGHAGTHESLTYRSWLQMMRRCTKPNVPAYPQYGGRGIRVCERWQKFENFLADMGERTEGRSIDRIDNDGDYEPGNCRWATRSEQSSNTRKQKRLREIAPIVRQMRQSGATFDAIRKQFGVSYKTARNLIEQGSQDKERP